MRTLMSVWSRLASRVRFANGNRLFDIRLGDWFPAVL
jgi:hypothetical protein